MTDPQIRVRTDGFRAIRQSDIIVNGITVVAGENGCGKSTLSKLLYYLFKTTSEYNALVAKALKVKLKNVDRLLDIIQHEMFLIEKDRNKRDDLRREFLDIRRTPEVPLEQQRDRLILLIKKTSTFYLNGLEDLKTKERSALSENRFKNILRDIINPKDFDNDDSIQIQFNKVIESVMDLYKEAFGKIESRPTTIFNEALLDVFNDSELPKLFEVLEYNQQIISTSRNYLSIPYSIQNAIYIDTPMMIGEEFSDNKHWEDLNELLTKKGKSSEKIISETISKEIINGEVTVDDSAFASSDFSYKRADGNVFNLLDCATGVKSFAILQLLVKNGSLTDKTLLIIDEPESNLHPQWIIEYARLIVLLNKKVGVKFFIASHNPDMVSAIKYISEKEKIENGLNYYLAEKTEDNFLYNYKHLGKEIDPIFASFNIAIERINQYGI